MSDSAALTAAQLVALYRSRDLSPVEVTAAVLQRIAAHDKAYNAFCLVASEAALRDAAQSERRWARGEPAGQLDGVPVSVKDMLDVAGWPTRNGSRVVETVRPADADAPAVARLRERGAVLVGKTTTAEYGWKAVGDSPLTGATRNPWDLDRTAGGSSAGAGAAVAGLMGPLAIGSDAGGSIRIPASWCGIVGLKPSAGRVAAWPPSVVAPLSHVGPMARTVEDVAMLLDALEHPDPRDPASCPPPKDRGCPAPLSLAHLRVGFSVDFANRVAVDPLVASVVLAAVDKLAAAGAAVERVDPPIGDLRDHCFDLWCAGLGVLSSRFTAEEWSRAEAGLADMGARGQALPATAVVRATLARLEAASRMAAFHARYDILVTPTVAILALPVGAMLSDPLAQSHWLDWAGFSYPFNLTGQPALSLPCGQVNGLPVGLQLVGPLHSDRQLLHAARAVESILAVDPAILPIHPCSNPKGPSWN